MDLADVLQQGGFSLPRPADQGDPVNDLVGKEQIRGRSWGVCITRIHRPFCHAGALI